MDGAEVSDIASGPQKTGIAGLEVFFWCSYFVYSIANGSRDLIFYFQLWAVRRAVAGPRSRKA